MATLLLSFAFLSSYAQAETVTPMYIGIDDIRVNLTISSSWTASCSAQVNSSSSSYNPSLTATLKKSPDGIAWTYVASWSASGTYLTGAGLSNELPVSAGYQYKLFVTARIHNAAGVLIETAYKNSSAVSH